MPSRKPVEISVVIPVYDRPLLFTEALESVLVQTGPAIEIIVVDDGSSEDTGEALDRFVSAKYPDRSDDIRFVRIDHCGMPGKVRNAGVGLAVGPYLAFLDSDDLWLPGKLGTQLELMRSRSGIAISHTRETWLRKGVEISQKGMKHEREGMIFHDALKKCIVGPSTVMMERKLFVESGGFREDLEIAEDYELWLRITAFREIAYVDRPFTVKRAGHGGQLSEKYGHIEYFRIRALRPLVDGNFFPGKAGTAAREELARKCAVYANGCRKRGKRDEAEEYFSLARLYSAGLP